MRKKYPCVRQVDQSDCGAAALATVSLYYDVPIALQRMRDLAGTDRVGTNLLGLLEAAEKLGFSAKAAKGPYAALSDAPLPAIAHVTTDEGLGHFVVLYRVGKRRVVIADPAKGIEKLTPEEFGKLWSGHLLLLTPDMTKDRGLENLSAPSPWRRFWRIMSCHRPILLEAAVCALLMTILGVSTSYFIRHLVDSVLVRGETRLLNALGIGMLAIAVVRILFGAIRQYLLAYISRKVDLGLISSYSRHILSLPMQFFEMRRVGEILSRVNDASKVREAISGVTLTAVVDGILVVLTSIVLWTYDVKLALVATMFAPLVLILILLHHAPARRRSREAMEDAAQLSAHLVEDISGVETIKAFGARRLRTHEGEDRLTKLVQSSFSIQKLNISMSSLSGLASGVASLVILWYGGHRVVEGVLTIGELMFFHTLLGYMLEPMKRLASVNLQLQDALVAIDRLFQVMDLDTEESNQGQAKFHGVKNSISLRDVSFRYGCRSEVLKNVDLEVPAGATVAIVGESGCGKSTLLKLLMRYYDPSEGKIDIDGTDMRDFDVESLRAGIGLVSQDAFIFNGTVRENIALGMPQASMNEIIQAAKSAGLEDVIAEMPQRYETVIGERGANLSGGQRQRLAIARALLRQPDILLLDEATSHLDTTTEQAIQKNLRDVFRDKTVLIVAHRLSTIREADLVCVIENGQIVEQGRHLDLIANERTYSSLWRAQSGQEDNTSYRNGVPINGNGKRHSLLNPLEK